MTTTWRCWRKIYLLTKTLMSETSLPSMQLNLAAMIQSPSDITDYQNFTASFQLHTKRLMRHSFKTADEQDFHIIFWQNYDVEIQHRLQDSQCKKSQHNLTLLSTTNHSEVTQTSKKTVNIKTRRETKVQHEYYTTTSLSLTDRLLITHSIAEKKATWEDSIEELTVTRTGIQITYQSQRKWLQQ